MGLDKSCITQIGLISCPLCSLYDMTTNLPTTSWDVGTSTHYWSAWSMWFIDNSYISINQEITPSDQSSPFMYSPKSRTHKESEPGNSYLITCAKMTMLAKWSATPLMHSRSMLKDVLASPKSRQTQVQRFICTTNKTMVSNGTDHFWATKLW
jgi:hypothetical protein